MVNAKEKTLSRYELRLGNWIKHLDNLLQVTDINEHMICCGHWGFDNTEDIEGIPLTPEILEKTGFVPIGHFTVMGNMTYNLGRNRYLSIGCIGTPNETLYVCEKEDIVCVHNFDYDGMLYLHTLQNLVHILTGTELPITFEN